MDWDFTMVRLVNEYEYINCALALGEITVSSARWETGLQVSSKHVRLCGANGTVAHACVMFWRAER